MAIQSVKLNLIPGSVLPVVNVSQYDDKRTFLLDVYEGQSTYDLTGKTVEIRGTKPDMHGFDYGTADGVISVSGNTVTVSTTQQMTAVGGQTIAELRIKSSGVVLGTINFIIAVEPSALSDDTIISDTDIPVIERYLQDIVDDCEAYALIAEGWAVGTQGGSAVSSSSPYYHNNASYYSGQAANSATSAGNSASSASGSATSASNNALKSEGYAVGKQNGSAVGSGSPYYHNNADYYNSQAAGSATAAGNSATAAAADALEAEGYAVGTQNGTPVGSGSPYYHNNAKYYSEQADPTTLASLTDVELSSPSNNQVLKYDSVLGKWVNGTGGGSGVPSGGTTGQALTKRSNTDGDVQWSDVATPNDLKAKWDNSSQKVAGAYNLLPSMATSQVKNNVTMVANADGSITLNTDANGASADTEVMFFGVSGNAAGARPIGDIVPGRAYKFVCKNFDKVKNGSTLGTMFFDSWDNNSQNFYMGYFYAGTDGAVLNIPSTAQKYMCSALIPSGTVLSNVTLSAMITPDLTATSDDCVPYCMSNRELMTEMPVVKSVSGTMSDTINTNVFVSYPTGFDGSNSIVIGFRVKSNVNNNWYSNTPAVTVISNDGNGVRIASSQADFLSTPFVIALMKV